MSEKELMQKLKEFVRGKTQRKAAKELDITPQYLNDILQGKRYVTVPKIMRRFGYRKTVKIEKITP